jgi:hypothetical protein
LQGENPVLDWSGHGLRPVLQLLDDDEARDFTALYSARLRDAYPKMPYGTLFPFKRLFFVATRTPMSGQGISVLIFGPSTLFFSEEPGDQTMLALIEKALADAKPDVAWECTGSALYIAPAAHPRRRAARAFVCGRRPVASARHAGSCRTT